MSVDPFEMAASLNAHRRHLKPEEKRERIEALLKAHPEKSDRSIAKTVGASPTTVGARRAELASTVQSRQLPPKRVGRDGKARRQPTKMELRERKKQREVERKRQHEVRIKERQIEREKRDEIARAECMRLVARLIENDAGLARDLHNLLLDDWSAYWLHDVLATALGIEAA
jgi:hypothetical protein